MKPLAVRLVSMPFAPLDAPSLGLTQLRGMLRRRFGPRVAVEIHYAGFDFARHLGSAADLYRRVLSPAGFLTHLGEWLFARAAFPDAPDTAPAYFGRFGAAWEEETGTVHRLVERHRPTLEAFLDRLIEARGLLEADVVGFTAMFQQTTASFALARRLKQRKPEILAVMGGPTCEGAAGVEFARRVPSLDFVFSGPALVSFPAFIRHLLAADEEALHRLDGVFSRVNCGSAAGKSGGSGVALLGDEAAMDDPVPLDYESFLREHEAGFPGRDGPPYLLFETSRGCWWGERSLCAFCGLNGSRPEHRALPPLTAIRHIQSLYPYAKRARCFVAADNVLPRDYPGQVFSRLRPPPGFRIKYETRAGLDSAALESLYRGGVTALQPGIESLSTSTLRRMRKGTTAFENLRFLKAAARLPIVLEWNLLLGAPGEPATAWEKLLRDIPQLHHLPPPQGAFPVMFVRHSPYHAQNGSPGLALAPQDFHALIYPFDPGSLERLATFFVNRSPDAPVLDPWLERVNAAVRRWRERWSGADGRERAQLRLAAEGGAWRVHDTRSGECLIHEISGGGRRLLETLEVPDNIDALRQRRASEPEAEAEAAEHVLDGLLRRGLLFEEDGRYVSLVQAG